MNTWHCRAGRIALLTLLLLLAQGLSRADAEAALAHCSGDGDEALLYAVQCIPKGGAAACADDNDDAAVAAEKLARRQQAELVEAQQVLARFTANNPAIR